MHNENTPRMRDSLVCVACNAFLMHGPGARMNRAPGSSDEADLLCMVHRARTTEGLCVLCGRRAPWASLWPRSDIGCCELCFRVTFGNEAGDQAAEQLWWYAEFCA